MVIRRGYKTALPASSDFALTEPAGDIADGFDGSDTNWLLGFGYDHRIGDNWTIGGEYMYHDFDDLNLNTLHLKAAYRF